MRLDRPVGTLLLLWPTLAALCMAAGTLPSLMLIVVFTLGTFTMRSAGCVINDYADRNVDGHVKRTAQRPLATGAIPAQHALWLFFGLITFAGLLILFLNRATQLLAVGGLALAVLYPFMKRWTHLPQVVLGAAFSWGISHGLVGPSGKCASEAWLMFTSSLLWIVAYDTEYAMVDRDDDLKIGVKSTAILFGDLDRLMIGILQASALLGFVTESNWVTNTSTTLGLRSWLAYLLIRVGLFATGSGTLALRPFATTSGSACACYWALYSSY